MSIFRLLKLVIGVNMAACNRVIANILLRKGLLTAWKRSQCLIIENQCFNY